MIDYSLIQIIPAEESHREFSYQVKKAAEGDYITQLWGWDEKAQRDFHTSDWQQKRPAIILYDSQPIGTIYILESEDYIEIGQFFIFPEYQNKGIGSHLLKRILDKADQSSRITKIAYLINNPVVSLYKRNGFEITSIHEVYCHMERKPNTTTKRMSKYKAVIFDLFGTLVENFSRGEYEKTLTEMATALGAPPDEFIRLWADTFDLRATGVFHSAEACVEHICQELRVPVTEAQVKQTGRIRLDYTSRNYRPRPGSVEVLTCLKSNGYKTALISDCTAETPLVWQKTPFAPLFNVTVFSCRAGVKKPDPRIYRLATDQLGVKPQDCLYIGDGSSKELTGALQVGMHPVLIRDPNGSVDAHFIDREDWDGTIITSLQEVLNLVK
jgi:putative hydrolase of the HAD superfamily